MGTQPCALFIQMKSSGRNQLVSSSVPGLRESTSGAGLQNMIDADSTLWTEHARNLIAAVRDTRNLLCQAGHLQAVFPHRHEHAEGAAGLALAFFAVTGTQAYWLCRQYKTHGAALASTGVGCGHVV